ncbi:MAG: RNA-binding protein [Ignavibacteriae bacterium]|nr:RNA-binding protein [Ignavibacteriota bacterium]
MHIHVANLPREIDEKKLADLFKPYGPLASTRIDLDRVTGKPTGFAEVEIADDEQGKKAIEGLHGTKLTDYPLSLKDITAPKADEKQHGGVSGHGKKTEGGARGGARGQGARGPSFQAPRRGGQRGA